MKLKRVCKIQAIIHDVVRYAFHKGQLIDSYLSKKQIDESGIADEIPELAGADILVRSIADRHWYASITGKAYRADTELWNRLQ